MMHFLASIGAFLAYLMTALGLVAAFAVAYLRSTPHDELGALAKGNAAAAIGLGGALIGFAIVLSRAIGFSTGLVEVVLWGAIGLAIQVLGHVVLSTFVPRLYGRIEDGDIAAGIMTASVAVTLGLINAASMTP